MGFILLLAGCNPAGVVLPTAVNTSTATFVKTTTIHPTQTATSTPEPTLPYGINVESLGKLEKKPSETAVDWRKSLEELGTGEYVITHSDCPEGGDCKQISAYSLEEGTNTVLVRIIENDKWPAVLVRDRLYFGLGEQFTSIQVIDFRNHEDYSIDIGNEYKFLGYVAGQNYIYISSGVVPSSPKLYFSISDFSITAISGMKYNDSAHKANYIAASVEDGLGCHPILITYGDFTVIPIATDCEDELLRWGDSPSGKWIWRGTTDEETYWETIYEIPGRCLLEHPKDVEYCQNSAEEKIAYQGEFYCMKWMIWTPDEKFLLLDQTNDPYYCSIKGVELIGVDGTRKNLRSHPGYFQDDLWTSDGQWMIWYDGSVDVREWGLYSPYEGGKVRYLGQGLVFDFSIAQVP
jgi:hypothetical protein